MDVGFAVELEDGFKYTSFEVREDIRETTVNTSFLTGALGIDEEYLKSCDRDDTGKQYIKGLYLHIAGCTLIDQRIYFAPNAKNKVGTDVLVQLNRKAS